MHRALCSALGAWAELQHATAIYVKDANVYMGGSAMLDRFHGFVEPVPEFYRRLDQLVTGYARTMDRYGLFQHVSAIAIASSQHSARPFRR
jgi:hypothetical protein